MSPSKGLFCFIAELVSWALSMKQGRKHLFAQGSRTFESIPPTEGALLQHCKRAVYQGGHIWGQTLELNPVLPNPSDWGWKHSENSWQPYWTALPEAVNACYELIHCGCKKASRGQCKCKHNALACTELCVCEGGCAVIACMLLSKQHLYSAAWIKIKK